MRYVDANIVLRYILDDHPKLSPMAKNIIDNNEIYLPTEVLSEVIYVLKCVYKIGHEEIGRSLIDFFCDSACELANHDVIVKSVEKTIKRLLSGGM